MVRDENQHRGPHKQWQDGSKVLDNIAAGSSAWDVGFDEGMALSTARWNSAITLGLEG